MQNATSCYLFVAVNKDFTFHTIPKYFNEKFLFNKLLKRGVTNCFNGLYNIPQYLGFSSIAAVQQWEAMGF